MQAEGLITAAQADGLRQGVAAQAGRGTPASARPRGPGWLGAAIAAGGIVVAVTALFVLGSGEIAEVQNVAETLNQPEAVGTMNRSLAVVLAAIVLLAVPI